MCIRDRRYTGPTDAIELKALLGLLFFSGVMRNSNLNVSDMFSRIFGPPIFRTVMSKNRFVFLLCCLRFDSKATEKKEKKLINLQLFGSFGSCSTKIVLHFILLQNTWQWTKQFSVSGVNAPSRCTNQQSLTNMGWKLFHSVTLEPSSSVEVYLT